MSANEKFRTEFLTNIQNKFSKQQVQQIDFALLSALDNYELSARETALATNYDINESYKNLFIGSSAVRGLQKSTLTQYIREIDVFTRYIKKPLIDVTANDIRLYFALMQKRGGLSAATMESKRCYLGSFFSWLELEEYIERSPMAKIKPFKVPIKIREAFRDEEIEALREACKDDRERAILEVLIGTGCRVSEVANLKLSDMHFMHKECIVRQGKGNKDRKVYPSDVCLHYLKKYLSNRTDTEPWLLLNKHGRKLSKETIELLVKRLAATANVSDAHPHKFRRTYATNLLDSGVPIQSVKSILGHCNINTTMIYYDSSDMKTKMDIRRAL